MGGRLWQVLWDLVICYKGCGFSILSEMGWPLEDFAWKIDVT